MKVLSRGVRASRFIVLLLSPILFLLTLTGHSSAQTASGTLRGKITDPSGAVIPQSTVTAIASSGAKKSTVSNAQGEYEIKGLANGTYTVDATAKGFASAAEPNVTITAGQVQQFDIALGIVVKQEKVEVQDQNTTVDVNPENNASSLIIKGKDLDALSDDPDEMQSELQALAGPSAGPNGGEIYIDGFTGGQIPPKSAIREIRINQNPFSAQSDKLGYGRIEIFTKPGTDKYHGQISVNGNDSSFNSPNPFLSGEPSYHTEIFDGNIGGPITKKASFFFDAQQRNITDVAAISAIDPRTGAKLFQSFPDSRTRTNLTPRFDFQLGKNDTLTARYQFFKDDRTNQGVGQFSLPSQAYETSDTEHTLQISETHIVSPKIV
ncbi:MAG: Cna B-type protein, partial [Acidobacteriaceae bacterium]|nr:Cna B-type protein [Acidobacteriaceae bacterium]